MTDTITVDYDSMTIPQLEELMMEFYTSAVAPATEKFNAACEALRRKKNIPVKDTAAGFNALLDEYDEAAFSIYSYDEDEEEKMPKAVPQVSHSHRVRVRVIATIAAVIAAFAAFSSTAFGSELEHKTILWVKQLLGLPIGDGYKDTETLLDALCINGADYNSVPVNPPEGYELTTMDVNVEPGETTYFAEYTSDDGCYSISAVQYSEGVIPEDSIKTGETEITMNGTEYWFTIGKGTACFWTEGCCTYELQGNLTEAQIIQMLEANED